MKPVTARGTLFACLAVITWLAVPYAQTDPAIGTWHLNVAKSKFDPGPGPKSNVVTIEAAGKGIKVTTKGVGPDGSPTATSYSSNLDGTDSPVQGGPRAGFDTITLKRIDATRVEGTRKLKGQVVQTYTREVSKDGKTMTVTSTGANAAGQKIHNVAVYEKK
jgi:hypothetical protein